MNKIKPKISRDASSTWSTMLNAKRQPNFTNESKSSSNTLHMQARASTEKKPWKTFTRKRSVHLVFFGLPMFVHIFFSGKENFVFFKIIFRFKTGEFHMWESHQTKNINIIYNNMLAEKNMNESVYVWRIWFWTRTVDTATNKIWEYVIYIRDNNRFGGT